MAMQPLDLRWSFETTSKRWDNSMVKLRKFQAPNYKKQIISKFKISMTETNRSNSQFGTWIFGHWILFVICDL
jgi:hypothetical protein